MRIAPVPSTLKENVRLICFLSGLLSQMRCASLSVLVALMLHPHVTTWFWLNAGSKLQHGENDSVGSRSTSTPVDSRPGQGFGEVVAQLCNTWKTMNKSERTAEKWEVTRDCKKWRERAKFRLCLRMYSEERRKNGEELLSLHWLEWLPNGGWR